MKLLDTVPKLDLDLLKEMKINVEEFQKKFNLLYRHWALGPSSRRDDTEQGRMISSALGKCLTKKEFIALFADDKKGFFELIPSEPVPNWPYWVKIAAAFGSKEIGNELLAKLHLTLSGTDELTKDIWALLAASGNKTWFEDLLVERKVTSIPPSAYDFISLRDYDWLEQYFKNQPKPNQCAPSS